MPAKFDRENGEKLAPMKFILDRRIQKRYLNFWRILAKINSLQYQKLLIICIKAVLSNKLFVSLFP